VPLLEVVTEPDLRSAAEAKAYALKLHAIMRYLEVNTGNMEKGVIRFEANVSVREMGSDSLNARTEIKNLNSFRALAQSIEYEIARQSEIYLHGGIVEQETLGFNESTGKTYPQRGKEEAHDYRYFPEPDLPALIVDSVWINSIRDSLPELPDAKTERFISDLGLSPSDARFLTSERTLADYFESVVAKSKSPAKTIHSWIAGEFTRYLNDANLSIDDVTLAPEALAKLIDMVNDKTIGASAGKTVLIELFKNGGDPAQIVQEMNLLQLTDVDAIQELVTTTLNDNPKEVEEYNAGKETLIQWFMGQVARATKGKADPNVARELLVRALAERRK
jgi:aspartyl-tRNA(Asn)/glutamyl-tRNA(Gln) amidotransferase subunit B